MVKGAQPDMTTEPVLPKGQHSDKDNRLASTSLRERSPPVPSPELQLLLEMYVPKKRIREKDRLLIKKIISYWQGFDGKIAICEIHDEKFGENKPLPIEQFEIHHCDENPANNEIRQLFIAHHPCNSSDHNRRRWQQSGPSYPTEREREIKSADRNQAPISELATASSRETQKHDEMRRLWNLWINDKKRGAFSPLGQKQWQLSTLAATAVHALGIGSKITYTRYIEEDVRGGILMIGTGPSGTRFVRYKGDPIQRYQPTGFPEEEANQESVHHAIKELEQVEKQLDCVICGKPFDPNEAGCSVTRTSLGSPIAGTCTKCMSKGSDQEA